MEVILSELAVRRAVSVADLCKATGASEATIRRDLNMLARQRRLNKVHGGAVLIEEEFRPAEPDMAVKRQLFTEEKDCIARLAVGLIEDEDVVFLDAGTSVLRMAAFLQNSKALFVTSNIECAFRLTERGLRTYVLGGALDPGTMSVTGAETMEALRRYNFTKAFLGVTGITISQGYTTPDPEAAAAKVLAAERAQQVYVLADSSKFGKVTAALIFPLEGAQIITDRLPDQRYLEYTVVREAGKETTEERGSKHP